MADWTAADTDARRSALKTLKVVDDLLSYMSKGKGKPAAKEKAIFAAAIVFAYGVWESYVEDLSIELASKLSREISPRAVPKQVHDMLQSASAWQLAVHPGWQQLWIDGVKTEAKGEGDKYGLNTAKAKQVTSLLNKVGLKDVFAKLPLAMIPAHLDKKVTNSVALAVEELVKLRSEIVHSGSVPAALLKHHAQEWRSFVDNLTGEFDAACRLQCKAILDAD